MGTVQTREVTFTVDQWIYLQNKLESILETEEDNKLEIISASIQAELLGLTEATEEEVDKAKTLQGSVLDLDSKMEEKQ